VFLVFVALNRHDAKLSLERNNHDLSDFFDINYGVLRKQ